MKIICVIFCDCFCHLSSFFYFFFLFCISKIVIKLFDLSCTIFFSVLLLWGIFSVMPAFISYCCTLKWLTWRNWRACLSAEGKESNMPQSRNIVYFSYLVVTFFELTFNLKYWCIEEKLEISEWDNTCTITSKSSKKLFNVKNILHFRIQNRAYINFQPLKLYYFGLRNRESIQAGVKFIIWKKVKQKHIKILEKKNSNIFNFKHCCAKNIMFCNKI